MVFPMSALQKVVRRLAKASPEIAAAAVGLVFTGWVFDSMYQDVKRDDARLAKGQQPMSPPLEGMPRPPR